MKDFSRWYIAYLIGILITVLIIGDIKKCSGPELIKLPTQDSITISHYDFSETMFRVYMQGKKDGFFNEHRNQFSIDTMNWGIYRRVKR